MNNRSLRIGIVPLALLALTLTACASDTRKDYGIERLSSCSIEESPFANQPFAQWSATYHQTVSGVVGADVKSLSNAICPDTNTNLPAPTPELRALAAQLIPWKTSPARMSRLSEADMGAVLLEYLRTYQCAMLEYRTFFYPELVKRAGNSSSASSAGTSSSQKGLTVGEFNNLREQREREISNELTVSRLALQRTLGITGRINRLRPVFADINCFVASSLDLRNQLGLAAEIGACLPRIRDAHNSLRDLKDL
jgi:hypothetical protein